MNNPLFFKIICTIFKKNVVSCTAKFAIVAKILMYEREKQNE